MSKSLEDVANMMVMSKELNRLSESVFLLSCIMFVSLECVVTYLTIKLYQRIRDRRIEDNQDDSKVIPALFSGIFIFVLSFYLWISFLGINRDYIFGHQFH